MNIGIHVKIGKGLEEAVKTAAGYDCNTFQMFSRSPRGGKARDFAPAELEGFHKSITTNKIDPVVVHMPYVLNLANPDEEMHKYAVRLIEEDLARCNQLGARYLVLHVGSHRGAGEEVGLSQMLKGLELVLQAYEGNTTILLENTSGAGKELGSNFNQLSKLIKGIASSQVAICFDTCHAFGAGYDLRSEEAVIKTLIEFEEEIGLEQIKVIHCNDSAFELGSKKDRHAHIGQGLIGIDGFRALINFPAFREVPFILETPVDEKGEWADNLNTLRGLVSKGT